LLSAAFVEVRKGYGFARDPDCPNAYCESFACSPWLL